MMVEQPRVLETITVRKVVIDGLHSKLAAINGTARELIADCKGSRIRHGLDEIIKLSGGAK